MAKKMGVTDFITTDGEPNVKEVPVGATFVTVLRGSVGFNQGYVAWYSYDEAEANTEERTLFAALGAATFDDAAQYLKTESLMGTIYHFFAMPPA